MTQTYTNPAQSHIPEDKLSNGVTNRIGNTPLIEFNQDLFDLDNNVSIVAKGELYNPGGSVKDRPAWTMIRQEIINGNLSEDRTLLDASSGNTGIAIAMIGASLGFEVKICIPKNVSKERLQLLRAYGAEIEITDPLEGTDGAIQKARQLVNNDPAKYVYLDQYNNRNNWMAHYNTTAEEIIRQTDGNITHFVTGLGTAGTFTGVTRRLEEELDSITCIAVQPDTPFHGLEGLKHMETAIKPGIYQKDLADQNIKVTTHEAQEMTRQIARSEGLLVGISSGANIVAASKVAQELDEGLVVTILSDRGERYLSEKFWSDEE